MNAAKVWQIRNQQGRIRSSFLLIGALFAALGLLGCQPYAYQVQFVRGGDPERGRQLVFEHGCHACHVFETGRVHGAWVGPPLMHWPQRSYIAGRLTNNPENLSRWLRDPQAVNPQTAMPNVGLTGQEALDITAYLYTLR